MIYRDNTLSNQFTLHGQKYQDTWTSHVIPKPSVLISFKNNINMFVPKKRYTDTLEMTNHLISDWLTDCLTLQKQKIPS